VYEVADTEWSGDRLWIDKANPKRPREASELKRAVFPDGREEPGYIVADRWEYSCVRRCGEKRPVTAENLQAAVDLARAHGRSSITLQYDVKSEGKTERPDGYGLNRVSIRE
jgi:hypothetical protein